MCQEVLAGSCPIRFIEWAAKGRELAVCFISQILVCSHEICRDMLLALSWDHLGKPYWQNWGHLYRQRIVGTEVDKFVVQGQGQPAWSQASINEETQGQGRKDTVMVTTFWQMWNYCCLHFTLTASIKWWCLNIHHYQVPVPRVVHGENTFPVRLILMEFSNILGWVMHWENIFPVRLDGLDSFKLT